MSERAQRILVPCPACGFVSLFVDADGRVRCSMLTCPRPTDATELLEAARLAASRVLRECPRVTLN